MIINLNKEHNLRGYAFEYISRVLMRRHQENNFIFLVNRYDSLEEITSKYRLTFKEKEQANWLSAHWGKGDLIEFVCEKEKREVEQIIIYEVKTKKHGVKRRYFEVCKSDQVFFEECKQKGIPVRIASVMIFEDWRFSMNIYPYENARVRTYSNFKK